MKNCLSTQHDWPQHTLFSASFTQRWAHAKGAWHRGSCLQGTTPFPSMNPGGFLLSSPNWKNLKRTDFRWNFPWESPKKCMFFKSPKWNYVLRRGHLWFNWNLITLIKSHLSQTLQGAKRFQKKGTVQCLTVLSVFRPGVKIGSCRCSSGWILGCSAQSLGRGDLLQTPWIWWPFSSGKKECKSTNQNY